MTKNCCLPRPLNSIGPATVVIAVVNHEFSKYPYNHICIWQITTVWFLLKKKSLFDRFIFHCVVTVPTASNFGKCRTSNRDDRTKSYKRKIKTELDAYVSVYSFRVRKPETTRLDQFQRVLDSATSRNIFSKKILSTFPFPSEIPKRRPLFVLIISHLDFYGIVRICNFKPYNLLLADL